MEPDHLTPAAPPTPRRGRRGGLLLLACLLAVVSLVLVLVRWVSPEQEATTTSSQRLTVPRPERTAPPAEVARIHRALHDLGRVCDRNDDTDRTSQALPPVAVILDFARRYPAVSFPIDDETGTTLTLLFVTRHSLRSCSPSLVTRVNRALPSQYREPTQTPTPSGLSPAR